MEPVSPSLTNALDNIARSVDDFTHESRNLRESVLSGTIQRVRYTRYTAIFAAVGVLLLIITIVLSTVQIKTILDAKNSRNAQFTTSSQNQGRLEELLKNQETKQQQAAEDLRQEAVRSAVVSSYCATSYDQVAQIQSCLIRNGVEVPDNFKLVK